MKITVAQATIVGLAEQVKKKSKNMGSSSRLSSGSDCGGGGGGNGGSGLAKDDDNVSTTIIVHLGYDICNSNSHKKPNSDACIDVKLPIHLWKHLDKHNKHKFIFCYFFIVMKDTHDEVSTPKFSCHTNQLMAKGIQFQNSIAYLCKCISSIDDATNGPNVVHLCYESLYLQLNNCARDNKRACVLFFNLNK